MCRCPLCIGWLLCSSAGYWALTRVRRGLHTSKPTSKNLHFASTDAALVGAACCSSDSWNKLWRLARTLPLHCRRKKLTTAYSERLYPSGYPLSRNTSLVDEVPTLLIFKILSYHRRIHSHCTPTSRTSRLSDWQARGGVVGLLLPRPSLGADRHTGSTQV